jgi:NitT/TauT family transport system substrate-binding protein
MIPFIRRAAIALSALLIASAAHAQTKITLAHTGAFDFMSIFVAQEQGFFKQHGLDVTLQQLAGGVIMQGLQGGSLQMSIMAIPNMVLAAEAGLELVAIAGISVIDKTDKSSGLIVGMDSGIASAKDLIGKKVGVPSIGGYLYVMARKVAASQGLDPNQVNFVEVNLPQSSDLLKSGTIQAVSTADPFIQRAVQSGVGKPLVYYADLLPPQSTAAVYGSTRQWAEANPEAVKAFRAAIAEAVAFAEKNPDAARANFAKYVKLPPEVLSSLSMPRLFADVTEAQMRYWVETMSEMKMIKGKPDPARLIAPASK